MAKISLELDVYFEDPFYVGMFYLKEKDSVKIARVVFNQEPSDGEIYLLVLKKFKNLVFSAKMNVKPDKQVGYKRQQRLIKKQTANLQTGTKSMQALKKQYEANKQLNKQKHSRLKKECEEKLYQLKKQKRKAKHRGH